MSKKKKRKNLHIPFALLLFVSLPLVLFMLYFSFLNLSQFLSSKCITEIEEIKNVEDIHKPEYSFSTIKFDDTLVKFPSDYDSLLKSLDTPLTQHQKTTLLIYGETIAKSKHTKITEAYKEAIENGLPILIPQEYINEYINKSLKESVQLFANEAPQLKEEIKRTRISFDNSYNEYIYQQTNIQFPPNGQPPTLTIDYYPKVSTFLLDLDSESINQAFYKLRVLEFLSKSSNSELLDFLNDLVIYSRNSNDVNAKNRLAQKLTNVFSNSDLNREGSVYWKISVVDGKSYVYPMYISEEFKVNDNNFNEKYDVEPLVQSKNSVRVPILMYHHINAMPDTDSRFVKGLYVTPEMFEEQLAYLVKMNYKSITPQELYQLLRNGVNPSQKSVMITFDDSTKGQYTYAYPLLKKYGFTAVFYIPSSKSSIRYEQLREMARNGMIIGSHSATHIDLVRENKQERLYSEIVGSRYTLKSGIGQDIISISYPGCVADKDVFSYTAQAGYLIGGSCGKSIDHYFKSRLSLSRVHVFSNMENLKNILSGKL